MVLIWYATEQTTATSAGLEKENMSEHLNVIERLLDSHIS